ncbi:hypothetical protein E3G52_000392 [Mycobacteroides abscessus]|nr:hypothetical protein [Mycobacteroides abscessus]
MTVLGVAVALSGCGGNQQAQQAASSTAAAPEPVIRPIGSVDMTGWKAEIMSASPDATPDMDRMYELTVANCNRSTSEFSTMIAADTDGTMAIVRRGMRYVCPSRLDRVNQAEAQNKQGSREVEQACATSPSARTPRQQDLAAAYGC